MRRMILEIHKIKPRKSRDFSGLEMDQFEVIGVCNNLLSPDLAYMRDMAEVTSSGPSITQGNKFMRGQNV